MCDDDHSTRHHGGHHSDHCSTHCKPDRGESVDTTQSTAVNILSATMLLGAKQSKHTTVESSSSDKVAEMAPQQEQAPVSEAAPLMVPPKARTPPAPPTKVTTKAKYRVTPHAKKGGDSAMTSSPLGNSNKFAALHSTDEEVESPIIRAQQTRKIVHPHLLGASGRDLGPGGLKEPEQVPSSHPQ